MTSPDKDCSKLGTPEDIEPEQMEACKPAAKTCCEQQILWVFEILYK